MELLKLLPTMEIEIVGLKILSGLLVSPQVTIQFFFIMSELWRFWCGRISVLFEFASV